MRLRALLAASAALVLVSANAAVADELEDCLTSRQRDCIVDMVLASARAQPDPMDRIAALSRLAGEAPRGGRVVIADTNNTGRYAEILRCEGAAVTVSPLGFLWCMPAKSVAASKP